MDGRIIDPTESDRVRIVITDRPPEYADRPVAVYVNAPLTRQLSVTMKEILPSNYRRFVFLEWDRRRRRGKRRQAKSVA